MKYTRRQFLGTAAAGVGAVLLNGCTSEPTHFDPYEMVELGKTGIKTTRLSMGTGMMGSNRQSNITRMGYEAAEKLFREVYNHGVRHFDLADNYGTHHFAGESLKIYPRKDYHLFSKLWYMRGRNIPEGVKPGAETEDEVMRFLKEMQTDYIDGLQLHVVTSANWNTELSDYMTALDKLKQRGIIRSHGISCHALPAIETAIDEPWVDTVHVRINPYGMHMDDTVENVEPVVKRLHQAGKGVIAMKVLGQGAYTSDEEKDNCFKYVLKLGALDVLTIGIDRISDIEDNEMRIRKISRT